MKRYIAALMAAVMLLTVCCSCSNEKENPEVGGGFERFVTEYKQGTLIIILDTETGERYLLYRAGYAAGLTHLEEED